ncbi:hypothetical protein ASE46_25310 [Bacillus sp. Root239]|nr:hypothetical protein ASE46_25310 [Bacillus sp. Root239]
MRDFSLVHIGTEVRERKGDFNKIVSLMLDSTYYDALEERNEHHQRKNEDMFSNFTDEEMMYYYVCPPTKAYSKGPRTKRKYKNRIRTDNAAVLSVCGRK